MSGSHINAKVAYLCNGVYKKAWLKPHREMALLDRVANQRRPGEESPCVTEITVLMACWKTNNFEDLKCSDEIAAFRKCIATAKVSQLWFVFHR
uniref:CHCH domain-containing protein n=1 Tax=Eptatretus burgeri TaxID=7764 RepID=A0A8C4QIA0_EPTBU